MSLRSWTVAATTMLLFLLASSANAAGWGQSLRQVEKAGSTNKIQAVISNDCANYYVTGNVTAPGNTNGDYGTWNPGDTFTFTATGNGTGSWRIVGDPSGSITYVSGGTFPGTLSLVVPGGGIGDGVGFYVDSYTGEGDTITGTCGMAQAAPIPASSQWNRILLILLLGLVGLAAFRRRSMT